MLEKLKIFSKQLKREINFYRLIFKDSRTPKLAKFLLWAALGYLALPFDIIPDFIPVIGQLDDLIIVPSLIWLAIKLVPKEVIEESKAKVGVNPRTFLQGNP